MSFTQRIPGTPAWRRRRQHELCVLVTSHIHELVDQELPPGRMARAMEGHMSVCGYCRREAEAIRALKRGIARVASDADPGVVERLQKLAHRLCSGEQETT